MTTLNVAVQGAVIQASDFTQCSNILQQPSGGQETGKYFLGGSSPSTGETIGWYVCSLSGQSVPVSVSIDTADVSATNLNAPSTSRLSSGGFVVDATTTGTNTDCNVAGNYTLQY
jgi:hypothetical protein